jgi:LacI family transcriptional regulator
LKEHGVDIPGEVAVIGFANELFTSLLEPSLTSIDQHAQQMGQFAAQIFLEETAEHKKELDKKVRVINPDLIIRQSSKKMDLY